MTESLNLPPRPSLTMRRPTLSQLPAVSLPDGYALRSFEPGDEAHWNRIVATAFDWTKHEPHFDRIMRSDEEYDPRRILFITHDHVPVATASAWRRSNHVPTMGYLHYVALLPEHGGRSLGYQISLACLHDLTRQGRTSCLLHTDDFRLPALKIYLKLGFEPILVDENQRQRWCSVLTALSADHLINRFAPILTGPVYEQV